MFLSIEKVKRKIKFFFCLSIFSAVELLQLNFNHFEITFITISLLRIVYITLLVCTVQYLKTKQNLLMHYCFKFKCSASITLCAIPCDLHSPIC